MDTNENNGKKGEDKGFGLPEGYFQRSAGSIMNKIEWEEEHTDFKRLSEIKRTGTFNHWGFSVPQNYFAKKEVCFELMYLPKLFDSHGKSPFITPLNYFEDAEVSAMSSLMTDDKNDLKGMLLLGGLKKVNPFETPQNYLEENKTQLNEILLAPKIKVFHLFRKKFSYAVAAMLVVVLGIWIYNNWLAPDPATDCGTIACIDKIDLIKSKSFENIEDEELYDLVNPAELEKKLEKNLEKQGGQKNKKSEGDSILDEIRADELLDEI